MYKWKKGIATWEIGKTLYISIPFTWLRDKAETIAQNYKGKSIIGGPGVMEPTYCDVVEPILFHNPLATFTTRGCPNNCRFCAVPNLEGDLVEIKDFRPAPVICDNNFLAASKQHIKRVIDKVKHYKLVDFNQGLEARKFTPELADILSIAKCHIRFAFDNVNNETCLHDAIRLCQKRTTKKISYYVLIGFDDTPEDAQYRLEKVREWDVMPFPMRYQPLDSKIINSYVHKNWTDLQLKNTVRYYLKLNWLGHLPFSAYKNYPLPLFETEEYLRSALIPDTKEATARGNSQ